MFNGLRRDDVISLKRNLVKLGFASFTNPTNLYGPQTEKAVRDFQSYYKLAVTGVADKETVNRLEDIAESPFQNGRRHNDTIQLKKDLDFLGYKAFTNPTTYYGVQTKELVESFQKDYGLPVSGIADSVTRAKIKELVEGPMFNGLRRDDVISLKRNLVKLGFASFTNPTNLYGPQTEKAVRDFQSYYKLAVTGVADKETVNRLEDIAESPFQNGRRHNDTIQLKKDLDFLGYKAFTNPTTYYGVQTKELVESFQKDYGLPVSGIADSVTRAKIKELVEGPMFNGLRRDDVISLKRNLVKLGFASFTNPTNLYGPQTEKAVRDFQSYYKLAVTGVADKETVNRLEDIAESPFQNGRRHNDTIQLKKDLDFLGYKAFTNPTTYYGVQTKELVESFQKDYGLPVSGIADSVTRAKIKELVEGPMFNGLRRDDVISLKRNLVKLGFASFTNPTNLYGPQTEKAVRDFQSYYKLAVTGVADKETVNRLEDIAESPFQNGRRHNDTIQLKKDLDFLGYKAFTNPTTYYGVQTKELVESFQKDYGLPVSGIADSVTRAKIKELVEGPMFNGLRRDDVISLKRNLVKLGFASFTNPTNLYGPQTEKAVRDFQSYYKLAVTGVADKETVNRLEDIAESPFQNGRRHNDTIQLKKDLDFLGYKAFTNPTTYYGVQTKELVESFQKDYGLPVSGIADSVTRAKIKELVEGPMFNGLRRDDVISLKRNLVKLGFASFTNPTNLYGPQTEKAVRDFQSYYKLAVTGVADKETVNRLEDIAESPFQNGRRHNDTIQLKKDLDFLGYKAFTNPTTYYGVQTKELVESFQKDYGLPVSGIADSVTRAKIKELVEGPMFNGLRRDDVISLKRNLVKLGFASFTNPTNLYGPQTEKAVRDFQSYYKLAVTGVADKETVNRLEDIAESPFQNGRRHNDTIQLKKDLDFLGYKAFTNPTTYYGVQTKELVESFQKDYGLPVSGIADSVTRAKIKELVEGPMFNGLCRDDVISLKRNLVKLGFASFTNPTNLYGPQTEKAVRDFQSYYKLAVTGVADKETVNRLEDIAESPFQNGRRRSEERRVGKE